MIAFIDEHREVYGVEPICRVLPIAPSTYRVVQGKAGVARLKPHAARHFFASRLIEEGATLKELQVKLGHDDAAFTMTQYGHLLPGNKARDRQLADAMLLT